MLELPMSNEHNILYYIVKLFAKSQSINKKYLRIEKNMFLGKNTCR